MARAIIKLPKDRQYHYINPRTRTVISLVDVVLPEGPIVIKRCNPSKGESFSTASDLTISTQMLWRVANALSSQQPVNLDRVLGASYNTRSALEALIAHTPQFYTCYPGRIEVQNSSTQVKRGHKHIIWVPDKPHEDNKIVEIESKVVISEVPTKEVVYESLEFPELPPGEEIEVKRRHTQIQIALLKIGKSLDFKTWIANNDKGIIYQGKRLVEHDGVIEDLSREALMGLYPKAARAGLLIDCIWFKGDKLIPAVMEVEHTTGITSGLDRMKNFFDQLPELAQTRWVIVAPDEDRERVIKEARKQSYAAMNVRFLSYSSVEELYSLCQRRNFSELPVSFIESFMERCL
ncbi:restriction endonuclease [Oceanidesulfovibrio marinus]|uniref:Restriction endonuclease n=1 Tax=Oceanidesulfovibrio marinus TaxID=370038 RepID=A0A6P1ZG88_9BACT|nr:restriction endonuclease [Oceanidesulfovibrio marinus]